MHTIYGLKTHALFDPKLAAVHLTEVASCSFPDEACLERPLANFGFLRAGGWRVHATNEQFLPSCVELNSPGKAVCLPKESPGG